MTQMRPDLILASSSASRRSLLEQAGIAVRIEPARIDERALEAPLEAAGRSPEERAVELAKAKAADVSLRFPASLVIGADQTMSLEQRVFHKPKNLGEAAEHLRDLAGKTHRLNSAVALARGGATIWDHVSHADMTMRDFDEGFVHRHLERVGDRILNSVGAYQLEGEGIQLFSEIRGDYFTILGLPLLPLLAKLRELEAIDG